MNDIFENKEKLHAIPIATQVYNDLISRFPTAPEPKKIMHEEHLKDLLLMSRAIAQNLEKVSKELELENMSGLEKSQRLSAITAIAIKGKVDGHELVQHGDLPGGFPLAGNRMLAESYYSGVSLKRLRNKVIDIYLKNPTLAEAIAKQNIVLGFGSGSATLVSVLQEDLSPINSLRQSDLLYAAAGGELKNLQGTINPWHVSTSYWFDSNEIGRFAKRCEPITKKHLEFRLDRSKKVEVDFLKKYEDKKDIYLALQKDFAIEQEIFQAGLDYIDDPQESEEERALFKENFPIVYLASTESIEEYDVDSIKSSIKSEVLVRKPSSRVVKIILVPADKVDMVRALAKKKRSDVEVYDLASYS